MKTIKLFIAIALISLSIIAVSAKVHNKGLADSKKDLKTMINQKFSIDLNRTGNYLYVNDIKKIEDNVNVIFSIEPDGTLKVVKTQSTNRDASAYAIHLLNNSKIDVAPNMTGRMYSMNMKMNFKV